MCASRSFRLGSPNVVSETVDGEAVILNLDSGYYYGLDAIASLIWDSLRAGVGEEALVAAFADHFRIGPGAAEAAVAAFADRLVEENLLTPTEAPDPAPPSLPYPPAGVAFTTPVLTRYEDIQELLIIDPIHEVDEDGWPRRPGDAPTHGD